MGRLLLLVTSSTVCKAVGVLLFLFLFSGAIVGGRLSLAWGVERERGGVSLKHEATKDLVTRAWGPGES